MQQPPKPPANKFPAPQASAPSHGPNSSSKGQLHVKLIQARGLNVCSSARPYVVVQFEQNEFVSRDPIYTEVEGTPTTLASSNAMSVLSVIASKAAAAEASKGIAKSTNSLPALSVASPSAFSNDYGLFGRISARDPLWKHEVSFDVTSEAEASLITFTVYDRADLEHGFLGTVQIRPVWIPEHTVDQWYKIRSFGNDVVSGKMHVQVTFERYGTKRALTPCDFELLKLIKRGEFGKVFQVRKKDTKRIYAMKVLSKKEIVANLQRSLESPFLVGLKFSFQSDLDLYLVTDFRNGRELLWHLQRETRFSEARSRFYIAELILALEHLHMYDIVYCDLKPENILLDATGHVALCDFGLSKPYLRSDETSSTFCGTTDYLAPEMILDELGRSKTVDFWSLGILLFEMCCGWSPFCAENAEQTYKNICFGRIRFPKGVISEEGKQFVKGLLNRNPKHRLGAVRDTEELKEHSFFSLIDWAALARKHVRPPFQPVVESDKSTANFDEIFTSADLHDVADTDLDTDKNPSEDWYALPLSSSRNGTLWEPEGIDIKPKKKNEAVGNPLPSETFQSPLPESQFTGPPTSASSAAGLSNEIGYRLLAVRNVVRRQQQAWSPFSLSSPSASTEYLSYIDHQSPHTLSAFGTPQMFEHLPDPLFRTPVGMIDPIRDLPKPGLDTWCAKLHWFEPSSVDGLISQCVASSSDDFFIQDFCSESSTETPGEPENTVLQEEVDRNTLEMTCGPMVEEHFWPLRCSIRHGKFHAYGNSIQVLVVHSRKQSQPVILSKLTNELASCPVGSTLSLTSFLDESRSRRERLWQFASEIGATDLQHFREAVWKDNLMIMLVLYEILTSKTDVDDILQLRGDKAQFILDLMQDAIRTHIDFMHILRGGAPRLRGARRIFLNKILELGLLRNVDRASTHLDALRLLVKLSEACDSLPSSLTISGVDNKSANPISGGSFGDIYEAQYGGNCVALKRLRLFQADSEENRQTRRKFCREALIWKNLDHDYVLPFLGVDSDSFPGFLCMVSPWMSRGSIVNAHGGPDISSVPVLMYEIAVGLQYLHSQNIVHGDLRGANILLDEQGHVRLADFGLTGFADGPLAPTNRGGSTRWMAPELLDPKSCGLDVFQRTFASDIYSFACVCLELYTGKAPFSDITSEGAILLKVIRGDRPECPTVVPDWCTQFVAKCWSHNPVNRPGTGNIIESIVKAVTEGVNRKITVLGGF